MKALKLFTLLGLIALLSASCSSSLRVASSSSGDDIYYNPSKEAIAQVATASNGQQVPMDNSYRDLLSETNRAIGDTVYVESDSTGNPYQDVLADSYEKAKRNRELGQNDPWNGVATSAGYSQSLWYATAYDPAFYNIIVMGNTVWAEPKYISSMFGYPYNSPYVNFGGYYSPYNNWWNYNFNWGFGLGWGNNWGWGYYDPWYSPYTGWGGYYGYGYGYPYYGYGYGYPSHGHGYYGGNGDIVYGNRYSNLAGRTNGMTRTSYSSDRIGSRYSSSSDRSISTSPRNSDAYSRAANSSRDAQGTTTSYSRAASSTRDVQGTPATYSRRPSAISQSRPVQSGGDAYTPSYSRSTRTSQAVFNEGGRNSSQSNQRSSAVVVPRNNSSTTNSSNNSSSSSSRNSSYTPTRSSSDFNSGSSSYTPRSSSSSSGSSSSGSSSGGGYSRGGRR